MPDKLLQNSEIIKSVLGVVGGVLVALLGLLGIKIRAGIKKDEKAREDLENEKEKNEREYRESIEKTTKVMWAKIDGNNDKLQAAERQLDKLGGRFEDLQRAFERLQQSHFEMSCKNMAGRILKKSDN